MVSIWGAGSFDNDAAMKWVEGLEDAADVDFLEATLDELMEFSEDGDAPGPAMSSAAIAAAETVAALAENPATTLPEEIRQWCFDSSSAELSDIQPKAVQAIGVVLFDSGLRELYEENGQIEDWETEIESLRDRLRA